MAFMRSLLPVARRVVAGCSAALPRATRVDYGFARFSADAAKLSSVEAIKQLRELTGAPMMDCKKSLAKHDWDLDLATQELRKRGLASVGKKADRVTAEGLVAVAKGAHGVAVAEVNCETDFVARNEQFQDLVRTIASIIDLAPGAAPSPAAPVTLSESATADVAKQIEDVQLVVRENIRLRRAFWVETQAGDVAGTYVHKSLSKNVGSMVAVVVLRPDTPLSEEHLPAVQELAHQLAMHCVAANPAYLNKSGVDASEVDKELGILREQAAASGKPEKVIEKMVTGRLSKFYEQVCFENQKFVMDDKVSVQKHIDTVGKASGAQIQIAHYLRIVCGDGIEKEEKDFAAEVAEVAGS